MPVTRPPYRRRASVFTCSLLLGAAGLFAACGSSPNTVGVSAGAGNSGTAGSGAGSSGAGNSSTASSGAGGSGAASSGAGGLGADQGGASLGGSSSTGPCGGEACRTGQICCGPVECGRCIPAASGQYCPDQCPAAGGTGGSAGTGGSLNAAGSGGAGGVSAGGTGGASGGTGGNSSGVDCHLTKPSAFPTFDRSCTTLGDCTAVVHQVDCCGTHVITGIKSSELARFNAAEQICDPEYPACGCAEQPTMTDTGQTATSTTEPVECLTGTCATYVP